MPSSRAIRLQIEAALADRIPSALTPAPKVIRPLEPTGIPAVDAVLEGGLPLGAVTEISGPECSGRTSLALGFIAHMTQAGRVCAWADASDALQPESAAAAGVDLARLLWVRCGLPGATNPLQPTAHRSALPRIEQALRVTDLLLQAGGFSAIVLDLGSIAPQYALRVPLATWFRYRAAAERSQAAVLLLTQHACAKSSAALALHLRAGNSLHEEATVLTGVAYRIAVERERFQSVPSPAATPQKRPQSIRDADWHSRTAWAGIR